MKQITFFISIFFLLFSTTYSQDTRRGFALQSEIVKGSTMFYAGGTIDAKIAYFDISFGGDLQREDISARIEYGMNLFTLGENNHIIFLGIGGTGGQNVDPRKNGYDWFFSAPFFTVGYKYHFNTYAISIGVSKQYGWSEKYYEDHRVYSGKNDELRLYVKFNLFNNSF